MKKILKFLRRHIGKVALVSGGLAFIFGILGFRCYYTDAPKYDNLLDWILSTIKLYSAFFVRVGNNEENWMLTWARALAPASVLFAALLAYLTLATEHWHKFRLRWGWTYRKRIIICGFGELGKSLFEKKRNQNVVIIEAARERTELLEDAIVLNADATSQDTLRLAGVTHAAQLHIMLGDDTRSIEAARIAKQICEKTRTPAKPLPCYLHILSPDVSAFLKTKTFAAASSLLENAKNSAFKPRIIDSTRFAGWSLLLEYAAPKMIAPYRKSTQTLHILFIGFDTFAQVFLVQMAHILHPGNGKPLDFTIVANNALKLEKEFHLRYPFIRQNNFIQPRFIEGNPQCLDAKELVETLGDATPQITGAFFFAGNTEGGIFISAENLRKEFREEIPFVVCTTSDNGLFALRTDSSENNPKTNNSFFVCNLARAAREFFASMEEDVEEIAKALHLIWSGERKNETTWKVKDNPNLVDWDDLDAPIHDDNRNQAVDLFLKLACYGFRYERNAMDATAFSGQHTIYEVDDVLTLGKMEHRRWMIYKYLNDWTYGETRDKKKRIHPNLCDWEKLDEPTQKLDITPIRATPDLLADNGYTIWRDTERYI